MSARAVAVIPAAGRSERFGSMKLLAMVAGEPLIAHTLRSCLDAGVGRVVVVCGPVPFGFVDLLRHERVGVATNPDPSRGMFSSIQAGVAEADGDCLVILPADMPFVKSATVGKVIAESSRRDQVVVPVARGKRGHPVALPGRLRVRLLEADPFSNLKDVIGSLQEPVAELRVDDPGVVRDVDRREDLEI
jgi:molybdenum cofactor cytidylyltransferase